MVHSFGVFLKRLRTSRLISINGLAQRAGISHSTVSRWESDKHSPSLDELESVLRVLKASASERRQALSLVNAPRAAARLRQEIGMPSHSFGTGLLPFGGDLLKAIRLRKGWSMEQVAVQMGIPKSTLSRWERSERWPSTEQLHALCYILRAYPEEVVALTEGGIHFQLPDETTSNRLDFLIYRYDDLQERIWQGETSLMDLRLLSLEAQIAHTACHEVKARRVLAMVYVVHSRWLLFEERVREAERYAYRALGLVQKDLLPEPFWLWAVHVIAKGAVQKSHRLDPLQGVIILEDWLPLAQHWFAYEAWYMRDIADYLSLMGDHDSALVLSRQALELNEQKARLVEIENARFDHACILLKAGQLAGVLPLLPAEDNHPVPLQRVRIQLVRTETLLALGERAEAQDWLQRAADTIHQYDLWRMKPEADRLAEQL